MARQLGTTVGRKAGQSRKTARIRTRGHCQSNLLSKPRRRYKQCEDRANLPVLHKDPLRRPHPFQKMLGSLPRGKT
eukprot:1172638-Prorocentrum_lima.AAC.1